MSWFVRSTDSRGRGRLPTLIVIGAQKCGTTSLHFYLDLHPQIRMSREKELRFFIHERCWNRGLEWYMSNFVGEADVYGESTTMYTSFPKFAGVAERMHSVVPEAKLIYLVRDPVERIVSNYVHNYARGAEVRPMAAVLADLDRSAYVHRSRYFMQLEQYLCHFPESSLLILDQDELWHRRQETLQEVFRFLQVDDTFQSPRFARTKHLSRHKRHKTVLGQALSQTRLMSAVARLHADVRWKVEYAMYFPFSSRIARPTLDEDLRQALIDHLRDDTDRLREYTGRDFEEWCV